MGIAYRDEIVQEIKDLFQHYADKPYATEKFQAAIARSGFSYLGCGVSRRVYRKGSLVVKVTYSPWGESEDQNVIEAENTIRHPTLTPPLFAALLSNTPIPTAANMRKEGDSGFLSVIVVAYASRHRVTYNSCLDLPTEFRETFEDLHEDNIGHIGKRWVALDTGYEVSRGSSSYKYAGAE